MKKLLYFVFVTLFFSLSAFAQTEGINFQGLARNAAGEVLVSQQISLRLSVLLGSESGAVAYVETRLATTNPQGIFSLVVGDGNAISKTGNFSSIDWGTAAKFIKVEMDPNAGNNFLMMGTTRMQAVPFAFYAYGVDAENVKGILPLGSGGTGVASISELKTSLAVDQINNTSDASKPISTATQAALATKANASDVTTSLATKVDKVTGKELSTNDYTTAEKTKLAAITGTNTGDQDLSGYATTTQLATKANESDVTTSLATKANTADVTTSLATKVDKVTGKELSTNDYTTAEKTKLAAITGTNTGDQDLSALATNTALALKANTADVTTSLATKVDKVTGKELSTNDYTTAEKTKLAAITGTNTGDQVNITGNAGTATLADNISATTNTTLTSLPNLATVGTITSGTISLTTDIATTGNLKAGNNTYPNSNGNDGQFLKTNGSGTLSWADVPSPNLGNYVTTNTVQTIEETKTFSKDITVNGITVGQGKAVVVNDENGPKNTAIGRGTLSKNTGLQNTAIGFFSLVENTSGAGNTAIGSNSLQFNVSGGSNTAVGLDALRTNLGSENTAVGRDALRGSASSSANTAIGYRALRGMSGSGNTGSLTGTGNTAVGKDAGINITSGSNNITIGGGDGVGTGSSNTLVGVSAQVSSASTSNATAIGVNSKSAVQGTAIGNSAFALASSATAIGNGAKAQASSATAIGNRAEANASNSTAIGIGAIAALNASNSTAIGYGANVSDPNTIQLGADGTTDIDGVTIPAVTDVKTRGAITAVGYTAFALDGFGNVNPAITATFNVAGLTTPGTLTAGTVTYPNAHNGANGQVLTINSTGTASWAAAAGGVPYTGATGAVNLGAYDLTVNGITVGRGGGSNESNTVIGKNALVNNTVDNVNYTGIENTAIGFNALSSNTTGYENTAIGLSSLYYNTEGYENTAIGKRSLYRNTTGFWNTANGHNAMESNTTGNKNTASGKSSLYNNTEGSNNTANGYNAMFSNTTGNDNTAYGNGAGRHIANGTTSNTTSDFSVYLGSNTKASADNAQNEVVIGYNAIGAGSNTIQLGNTAVTDVKTSGNLTVNGITVGKGGGNKAFNTAIGSGALFSNTGGNNNTAIGASALFSNTEGGGNIAIGGDALALNTSGLSNTAIGGGALSNNVTGEFNTAIGYLANVASGALTNTTAIGNGAIVAASNTIQLGADGTNNTTPISNVKTSGTLTAGTVTYPNAHNSTGGQVLTINSTGTATWAAAASGGVPYTGATGAVNLGAYDLTVNGITVGLGGGNVVSRNTAIGSGALQNNSSNANGADGGLNNTAIGSGALSTNTVGDENTASGYRALRGNTNGRFNTASGSSALINNTSGDYNTAFGLSALQTNGTGSNNTAIGSLADVGANNLTNATAIGFGARVSASNTIQLGADGTTRFPNTDLIPAVTDVKTSGAITASNYITSSDLRLKSNISPLANSLATVMQLNPVHYMKKSSLASTAYTRKENGFIAQEIQKILPFIVTEGTDENKLLSVDYNSFIPMLTKAIQEQQKQIEDQNAKIAAQQKQIEELIKLVKGQ